MFALRYGFSLLSWLVLVGAFAAAVSGCASYVTPGEGVSMSSLSGDSDIRERFERKPSATWPARVAVCRVQSGGYRSYRSQGHGEGRYSVVTARDVERDEDFKRVGQLPMIAAVVPVSRMILPAKLESDRELRLAAASLHADILLVYSFDTAFRVDGREIGPLSVITLGTLPINDAVVTSTASAALFDVRSGFVYGLAEASATEKRLASAWTTQEAADSARATAERRAFEGLLDEMERTWKGIAEQHAVRRADARGSN